MISDHSGSSECLYYIYFLLFVSLMFEFVFVFVRKFVFAVCLCRAYLTDYPGSEYDTNTYFVKNTNSWLFDDNDDDIGQNDILPNPIGTHI